MTATTSPLHSDSVPVAKPRVMPRRKRSQAESELRGLFVGKPCIDMHFVRMDWNRAKKKHDRITEDRTVTLMAIAGNYGMVRRKGCMPYVASLKDLRPL